MILRAHKISSSSSIFKSEVEYLKQLFSNNNYPIDLINSIINECTEKLNSENSNNDDGPEPITIYYENQMTDQYKKRRKGS